MSGAIVDVPPSALVRTNVEARAYFAAMWLREGLAVGTASDAYLLIDTKSTAPRIKRVLARAELARRRRLSR